MMSEYKQHQAPEVYPPPVMAYPYPGQAYSDQAPAEGYPYVAAPPPVGYPTLQVGYPQNSSQIETKSRGEGFWKGCVAALCCCWVLDFCCGC